MIDSKAANHAVRRQATCRGVTLIEVMISIVLVSTILLASLTASANLQRNDSQRRNSNSGQQLGTHFLDEVTSMDFRDRVDPVYGIETGESASDRTTLDDVDDYHNYSVSPPTHRDGTAIDDYSGWSVSIRVVRVDPADGGITTSTDDNSPLRFVIVSCTSPDGTKVDAGVLVSDTPNNAGETTSYETWRRVKLTFPDREVNVTAPLRNHPEPTY